MCTEREDGEYRLGRKCDLIFFTYFLTSGSSPVMRSKTLGSSFMTISRSTFRASGSLPLNSDKSMAEWSDREEKDSN